MSELTDILISPHDGSPLSEDLRSEGGRQYEYSDGGVLLLDAEIERPMDVVYQHPAFQKWEELLSERLRYYTGKSTIAGRLADLSHKSIEIFNDHNNKGYLLDLGCGDGAQLTHIKDKSRYIGVDRNITRLEILKKRYPEATVIYCDAAKLPFRPESISKIYSANAFEHFWYLKEVVLECHRCLSHDGMMRVVFPTEGGLWSLGRALLSKPRFTRKHPDLEFEIISHIEHCNNATQIIRTLETFFKIENRYLPTRIPSVFFNALVEVTCRRDQGHWDHLQ